MNDDIKKLSYVERGGVGYEPYDPDAVHQFTPNVRQGGDKDKLVGFTHANQADDTATTYTFAEFVGATELVGGSKGVVPAPTIGDRGKFLKGDGTWTNALGDLSGELPIAVETDGDYGRKVKLKYDTPLYSDAQDEGKLKVHLAPPIIKDANGNIGLDVVSPAIVNSDGKLTVKYDNSTIKLSTENGLYLPLDGTTIKVDANSIKVPIDNSTIVYDSNNVKVKLDNKTIKVDTNNGLYKVDNYRGDWSAEGQYKKDDIVIYGAEGDKAAFIATKDDPSGTPDPEVPGDWQILGGSVPVKDVVITHTEGDPTSVVSNKVAEIPWEDVEYIESLIPEEAQPLNKLADKEFVNSSISTNTATFRGTFDTLDFVIPGTVTTENNDYAFWNWTDGVNKEYRRYKVVSATESEGKYFYLNSPLTDLNDHSFSITFNAGGEVYNGIIINNAEGIVTYTWAGVTPGTIVVYNNSWTNKWLDDKYRLVNFESVPTGDLAAWLSTQSTPNVKWRYEYTLNNSSFTQAQWNAVNSGINSTKVGNYDAHIDNTDIHVTTTDKATWNDKTSKQYVDDNDALTLANAKNYSDGKLNKKIIYQATQPSGQAENDYWYMPIEPVSVTVKTAPTKTAYFVGEALDLTGLVLTITSSTGTTEDVPFSNTGTITSIPENGYILSDPWLVAVTIGYTEEGKTVWTQQPITVTAVKPSSIEITTPPTKVSYWISEPVNMTGIVTDVTYNNGTHQTKGYGAAGLTYSPAEGSYFEVAGTTSISVTYTEEDTSVTCGQEVTVSVPVMTGIDINTAPTKVNYVVGDKLTMAGLKVNAHYSDGTTAIVNYGVSGLSYSPAEGTTLTTAATSVTITYTDGTTTKACTQAIVVAVPYAGLTFIANTAGSTITLTKNGEPSWTGYYSRDNGTTWTAWSSSAITLTNVGDRVCFKGTQTAAFSGSASLKFTMTGSIAGSGNCMSLWCGDSFATATALPYAYAGYKLFDGCTSLTTPPSLPATTLSLNCYNLMFNGCTSLTSAPALPAMTCTTSCYTNMFAGCNRLTAAPSLPATTLASACYTQMFVNCTALTTPPALHAAKLMGSSVLSCYYQMFGNCTSLQVSDTQTTAAPNAWRMPTSGTFTNTSAKVQTNMFTGCAGSRSSNNMPGATGASYTYYTQNTPV